MNRILQWTYDPRFIIAVGVIIVVVCAHRILSPTMFWLSMAILILVGLVTLAACWFIRRKNMQQGD